MIRGRRSEGSNPLNLIENSSTGIPMPVIRRMGCGGYGNSDKIYCNVVSRGRQRAAAEGKGDPVTPHTNLPLDVQTGLC
jgi:hypothetical protein